MTRQEDTISDLLASFDFTTAEPDPYRKLLVKAWNAGAHHAVFHDWDDDSMGAYLEDPAGFLAAEEEQETDEWLAEQEPMQYCHAQYITRGGDPYATSCDQPKGHYPATAHDAPSPFDGDDMHRVTWMGGGSCAGDALPYTNVEWYSPTSSSRQVPPNAGSSE